MRTRKSIALAVVAAALVGGCADDAPSSGQVERGANTVALCSAHGGVIAFDDDAVICRDQTARGARAARAIDACRGHRGVSAFDDDIVICGDQTFHEADEG